MITVYTRPGCSACTATKLWLKRNKIAFEELDIEDGVGLASHFASLPVVAVDGEAQWSGFRIDKLAALKTRHPPIDNDVIGS